jgi:hypothetical protein
MLPTSPLTRPDARRLHDCGSRGNIVPMNSYDPLSEVLTTAEAARFWHLTRNAITMAARNGRLPARPAGGKAWLVTVGGMVEYQRGRWYPDLLPERFHEAARAAANALRWGV